MQASVQSAQEPGPQPAGAGLQPTLLAAPPPTRPRLRAPCGRLLWPGLRVAF